MQTKGLILVIKVIVMVQIVLVQILHYSHEILLPYFMEAKFPLATVNVWIAMLVQLQIEVSPTYAAYLW